MFESVRRLSLVLGVCGACVYSFVALEFSNDEIYTKTQPWKLYEEQYEKRLQAFVSDPLDALRAAGVEQRRSTGGIDLELLRQVATGKHVPTFEERLKDLVRTKGLRSAAENVPKEEPRSDSEERTFVRIGRGLKGLYPVSYDDLSDAALGLAVFLTHVAPTGPTVPRPGAFEYLVVVAMPIFGFLLPWGTVRVIGWVIQGFLIDFRGRRDQMGEKKDDPNQESTIPPR